MGTNTSPQFRPRGPKWFHPAELHELAILRALVPDSMPVLAALVVLRPGDIPGGPWEYPLEMYSFRHDVEDEFVQRAWPRMPDSFANSFEGLIQPALKLASCAHPQAFAEKLRARRKRIRLLLPTVATVATGDSGETYGRHLWSCVWGGDSSKEASRPPAMTPREAVAALAPKVALPYLLAHREPALREWVYLNVGKYKLG